MRQRNPSNESSFIARPGTRKCIRRIVCRRVRGISVCNAKEHRWQGRGAGSTAPTGGGAGKHLSQSSRLLPLPRLPGTVTHSPRDKVRSRPVTLNPEHVFDLSADIRGMIISTAMLRSIIVHIPLPFIYRGDVMTKDNRRLRFRQESGEKIRLSRPEGRDLDGPSRAARIFPRTGCRISSANITSLFLPSLTF